jgi:putative ABC transport system permease protein
MKKKSGDPPQLAENILRRMRKNGEEFSFLGDMNEEFFFLRKTKGSRAARSWYWGQVFINLPTFLKDSIYWSYQMFKNYLIIIWRNIKRNKGFSFINITGLAVGMAACLIILLWVRDELSYNRFHANINSIYLAVSERVNHRGDFFKSSPVPLAESLRSDFPEIAKVVRFQFRSDMTARYGKKIFNDWQGAFADPEVFAVFTFPFLKRNADSAFENVDSIVLTRSASERLFGGIDSVGQMMELGRDLVEVTGILEDIPKNSDIQVDYFRPFQSMREITEYHNFIWNWFACNTYVQLKEGIDPVTVNPKIAGLLNTNRPWSTDPLESSLFPLADLHLHALGGGGPIKYIYVFTVVAVLILLIACINFMNLSTAKSAKRAKEVGLRKVVGSKRMQLVKQFFMESLFFSFLSALIAVLLAKLSMPLFNQFVGKQLSLVLLDAGSILGLAAIAIFTGILAGSYPALVLSSFRPVDVLKGNLLPRKKSQRKSFMSGARFRQALVITQFITSIGLILCALIVFRQLDYLRNADMGFDKDNLVRISIPENYDGKWESLKTALVQSANIEGVTATSTLSHGGRIDWDGASGDMQYLGTNTDYRMVDFDYIDTHKMEIVAGRNFSREFPSDFNSAYLVNEEAIKAWDFQDPVGKRFSLNGSEGTIIGVYKNQHFGLRYEVKPSVLYLTSKTDWDRHNYLITRLKANHIPDALENIKDTWHMQIADLPAEFHFVDEMIDELYRSEERLSGLVSAFTLLAIIISCLGLFGMASFIGQQRTREIGIRKVLGASVSRIILLLTGEFAKWVLIANIVAWPVAFYAMRSWLNDYPYRVKIGIDVFIISGLVALAIALTTVIYQAIKSAVSNPADSLKYE